MFKLEFDPKNALLAAAMGRALMEYGATVMQMRLPATAPDGDTPAPDSPTEQGDTPATDADDAFNIASGLKPAPNDADTTGHTDGTTESPSAPPSTATDAQMAAIAKVDLNGVVFDKLLCAVAAKPFYASGKRGGQWKKKHGVTDAAYDTWYAGELLAGETSGAVDVTTPDPTVNAGGAFSPAAAGPDTASPVPTDIGTFIAWFSEMQAAKRLDQTDIDNAYAACGLTMSDLIPPNAPDVIAANVASLHTNLMVVAG